MPTASPVSLKRIHICLKFVRDYSNLIQSATPHLYLSALAQTPAILDTTSHCFTALPKVVWTSEKPTDSGDTSVTYMTLHGHTGTINSVEFSRDQKYAVTASADRTVRIWDTQTYSQVGDPLTGHTDDVQSACFLPDGRLVVSTSKDGTVRIWNAQSKAHEQVGESFTGHRGVWKASFLANGKHVVSASEDTILFWDAASHAEIAQPLHNRGLVFAVSPDGNYIALPAEDFSRTLEIVNIQTGARIGQLLTGHQYISSVSALAFSPDGQHIVASEYGALRMWDAKTCALINDVMDVTDFVSHIGFYLDESYIMTSGTRVRLWDLNIHSQIQQGTSREISFSSTFSAISPKGDRAASVYGNSIRLWSFDLLSDHLARTHTLTLTSASYSPDGKYITTACNDNTVRIWDEETYSQVGNPLVGHSDKVNSASFSPDGRLIVTASEDQTVRIWNAQTGTQIGEPLTGHTGPVVSAFFSPDGTYLVSADKSNIQIWSAGISGLGALIQVIKLPLRPPKDQRIIQSISFSPYGQFLMVNTKDYTQVLDLSTGGEAAITPPEHRNRFACFSPAEHLMLFFGRQDSNLHLWNADLHCVENVFRGHTGAVLRASFSPDGRHIVSTSSDHTIRVWSFETGSQTAVYQNPGNIHNIQHLKTMEISPNGRRILSVYSTHIQIWAMPDSLPPGTDLKYSLDDPNVRI